MEDQAGKTRVVAIANYWLQTALHPVHKYIFSILKDIPMDGTFDQDKVIKHLLVKVAGSGQSFSCFDLSNATDRLPLDVQVQILDQLGLDGSTWGDIVSIP